MEKYFNKNSENVLKEFNVTKDGLNDEQVKENINNYGKNSLVEKKKETTLQVFLNQFKDLLVFILIIAGIISMISGNIESTLVIFFVITMNAILGTVQHFKAEKSLDLLRELSSPSAKVIRNGIKIEIDSKNIVPGDILLLEAGDMISADGRILKSYSLKVNESSLTGESLSVDKISDIIEEDEIALGDQKNMVFSGSLVTYGRALVIVTSTGMKTEIGKIATLMEETQEKKTPLQVNLDDFSKKLAFIILSICTVVFGLSLYRGISIIDSLMFSVALAVAAIPEALSSIVTIVLALGTQKMVKENAIVKKLKAVEGSVSVICSDKTGTLTQNKMTTKKVYVDGKLIIGENLNINNRVHKYLLYNMLLCNDSTSKNGKEMGDPTEIALVNLGHKLNFNETELREEIKRLSELPFDSNRKLISILTVFENNYTIFTKGALDVVLNRTSRIMTSDGIRMITEKDKENILNINKELSENGLRVLAFGYKEIKTNRKLKLDDENKLIFLGLVSIIDPPRE